MQKNSAGSLRLFKALLAKMRLILFIGFVAGIVFYFGLHHIVPPMYTANVTVYINNSQKSAHQAQRTVTQTDLMVSEILIPTYERMLKSKIALEDIAKRCNLEGYSPSRIGSSISTTSSYGTAILKIYVTDKNPENAATIANTTIETLSEVVSHQIEGTSVVVIDYANVPNISSSLSREKNALIGIVLGITLSAIYFYNRASKRVIISSKDDLREILGIPFLGAVPYMEKEIK